MARTSGDFAVRPSVKGWLGAKGICSMGLDSALPATLVKIGTTVTLISMTASHHNVTLGTLDRLSAAADTIGTTVVATCEAIRGAVVLATCYRFELYLDVAMPLSDAGLQHAAGQVARLVAEGSGVDETTAVDSFLVRSGTKVAEHLFSVAAGLESMVIGEQEIAGQVKRAVAAAREAKVASPGLELLFRYAAHTSKAVATQTSLNEAGRSTVSAGFDLVAPELPPWRHVRALIIGTGTYAGAALAALRGRGCSHISVYSPSGRANAFANERGVLAAHDLSEALAGADFVVSCSGTRGHQLANDAKAARPSDEATGYVLDQSTIAAARSDGPHRLVILDLALHRDVDPTVGELDEVTLHDLASLATRAPSIAQTPILTARSVVVEAVRTYEETRLGREADPVVIALVAQADDRIASESAEAIETAMHAGTPVDAEAATRTVRRRVRTELHQQILGARAEAISAARATKNPLDGAETDIAATDALAVAS